MMTGFFTERLAVLRKNESIANVLKLAGGSAMGQVLVIASTPFITRIYAPSQMGLFGVFVAFLTFASVGATLRYDVAIVSSRDRRDADVLLMACTAIALPYVLLATVFFVAMIHFDLLGYATLPGWSVVAMAITIFITGLFSALRFWYVGRKRFNEISLAQIYQGAGRASLPLIWGFLSRGWGGLVCGEIAGRMFGGTKLIRGAWPEVRDTWSSLHGSEATLILRRYWKYPAVFLPSSALDAMATSLPLPVISSLFGIAAAGQYFLVFRLATAPSALVSAGVADVLHARLTDAARTDRSSVHRIMMSAMRKLFMIGLLIYVPAAIISPFLFSVVFGASWKLAGILMVFQSLASVSGLIVTPLSRALNVSKHPELKFIPDICRSALPVSGLVVAHHIGLSFVPSMVTFWALSVLSELLYLWIIWLSTTVERQISFSVEETQVVSDI